MKQTNQNDLNNRSNKTETEIKSKKDNNNSKLYNSRITSSPIVSSTTPGSINVVCRFRPLNEKEKNISQEFCCEFLDYNQVMVRSTSENNTYKFNFDRVFDPTSHQQEVYDFAAKNIVESVLEGFNGTIFAYGQTSSGKTHTMQGVIDNPEKEGIIPRMIRHLFNFIVNSSSDTEYIVKVSMIEIYMEKIKDLIDPERTNLNVREDKAKGIYIEELSEHYVVSEDEVLEIMKLGSDNRSVAATNMNEHSSRSHSIFIMTIHQNNVKDLSAKTGKLYLVDLAGSEKISKTGATGLTLEEAKTINKSLTTLGMVINSLTDGKSTHIPYRESKLTRVLQESLGGNAKTCLIITCSPSIYNESESLSTLRFGLRAKKIKNKPKINKETTVAELKIEIDRMDKTIQKLNRRIKQLENYIVKNGLSIPLEDESGIDNENEVDQERENSETKIRDDSVNIVDERVKNDVDDASTRNENKFDDPKVSFGNLVEDNLSSLMNNDKISRMTAGFGNLINKTNIDNEKLFANGNFEQMTKLNNDYLNRIKDLEEENKTLNEQIEFLHEFISRLDKELEHKSNAIENLEITNKKNKEEIDNLKNNQNENLNIAEDQKTEESNKETVEDNIHAEKIDFSKEESKTENIVSELDSLVKEFKENTYKLNNHNTIANNNKEFNMRQTLNSKAKFSQQDLEELQKKICTDLEEKMFEEKRKHENEKKTILKVLEEKCEKFNILEIENGDLKSKIKSLEIKMSPDEKINKKLMVKLEQNIEQLNLMLEKSVAEKSQLAINLKVLEKKFYYRNQELEKLNKENVDLREQFRRREENFLNIQRGTLRTLANTNGNLVKIIRGGISNISLNDFR